MLEIKDRRLRRVLRLLIPLVLIPALAVVGTLVFDAKKHIFISLMVAVLAIVLFIAGFERRQTGTRRMVIVSVMTALSVAGRFIPFFKPVTAITVITAVYLGPESGFAVGAFSALLSNFYFGQGPWTPFQMLAWGLVGLIAGYLALPLKKSRALLLAYGVLSGFVFSLAMDVWTVIWYNGGFVPKLFLSATVTALPHTLLYAVSNFAFLFFMAKPFGDKLQRIKIKYGV
ncbi:MAG: ECF transporter S component [Clostridia bacterium]|nr:ECF transporter S component [Clostridia bacterium]